VGGIEGCEGSGRLRPSYEVVISRPSFGLTPLSGHGGGVTTEEGVGRQTRVLVQ
jgi:hypothetical protein